MGSRICFRTLSSSESSAFSVLSVVWFVGFSPIGSRREVHRTAPGLHLVSRFYT
jgi:hypothetical protein